MSGQTRQSGVLFEPALDGLRFLAFLVVFLHHVGRFPPTDIRVLDFFFFFLHQAGWIGLDVFFCISAYLLTKLIICEYQQTGTLDFNKFYARRILRIFPAYWTAIAVYFFFLALVGFPNFSPQGLPEMQQIAGGYLLGLLVLVDNFIRIFDTSYVRLLGHLWSISAEAQFYLVLPLFMFVMMQLSSRNWVRLLLAVILFALLARAAMWLASMGMRAAFLLPALRPDAFVYGILIACMQAGLARAPRWLPGPWACVALAVLIISACGLTPGQMEYDGSAMALKYSLTAAACALCVLAVTQNPHSVLARALSNRRLAALGKITLGIYLFHHLALALMVEFVGWWFGSATALHTSIAAWLLCAIPALLLAIAAAGLSYRWVELPFLRLKRRVEIVHGRDP